MCEAALVARVSKVLMLVQGRLERAREAPERWLPFLASMAAALDDGRLQLLVSNRYDQVGFCFACLSSRCWELT